jgi:hypothetical protein
MAELEAAFETEVTSWDGIQAVPHRFGGTEFQWNNVEIGHIHSGGMTDIPFTRRIREALVEAQIAQIHHTLPDSGWITFHIRTPDDVETAQILMRLSYIHKRRRVSQEAFLAELETLALPGIVKTAARGQHTAKGDEE